MPQSSSLKAGFAAPLEGVAGFLFRSGRVVRFGSLALVVALSPSTYGPAVRTATARQICLCTLPVLVWFTLLSTLISLVLIRIVFVTAVSYGLSQYALEMVVRVLVIELIPLAAALTARLGAMPVRANTPLSAVRACDCVVAAA